MIDRKVLRQLTLEALLEDPETQFLSVVNRVETLAVKQGLMPSREECAHVGIQYSYYQNGHLNPIDKLNINEIIWDLIAERVLTLGADSHNLDWPFLRLTDFGKAIAKDQSFSHYDPDGYIAQLTQLVPNVDPAVCQYIAEGLNCFRQRLYFASAVMCGAAAEKVILLLLASLASHEANERKKKDLLALLERPSLPKIFELLQEGVGALINHKAIPYGIHQGCLEHLISLFEMVRSHRNEAVHPKTGTVSKEKIFLTIQTLPVALSSTYRLIEWFKSEPVQHGDDSNH